MALLSKSLLMVTIIAILMAVVVAPSGLTDDLHQKDVDGDDSSSGDLPSAGLRRLLARYKSPTCDTNPRACYIRGSAGPNCCNKQCVNVKTDRLNCRNCGRRCKFTESCCKGECVNLAFDKGNCGKCGKTCRRGSYCIYGMCGYV